MPARSPLRRISRAASPRSTGSVKSASSSSRSPAASMPAVTITSATSAFSGSKRRAPSFIRSRSAVRAMSTAPSARSSAAASARTRSPMPWKPSSRPICRCAATGLSGFSTPIAGWARRRSRRRFMAVQPKPPDADAAAAEQAALLERRYGHLSPLEVLERAVDRYFVGSLAGVSSFGADSAVLLHLIAQVDRNLPVIFLDTGKHFDETLGYRDALIADLGLT